MEMQDSHLVGKAWVVEAGGRVDAAAATLLEAHIRRGIDRGEQRLVLDLAGVSYMASAGIRVLLSVAKLLKAKGGRMVVSGVAGPTKQIFDLSGIAAAIPMVDTLEQAAGAVL